MGRAGKCKAGLGLLRETTRLGCNECRTPVDANTRLKCPSSCAHNQVKSPSGCILKVGLGCNIFPVLDHRWRGATPVRCASAVQLLCWPKGAVNRNQPGSNAVLACTTGPRPRWQLATVLTVICPLGAVMQGPT